MHKFEWGFSRDQGDGTRPKVEGKGQRAILPIERDEAGDEIWFHFELSSHPFNSKPFAGSAP